MAMKTCKECGAEISNKAKACPKCGKDTRNFFLRHKVITFILAVILIGMIASAGDGNTNTITTTTTISDKYKTDKKIEVKVIDFSSMSKKEIEKWCDTNKINLTITEEYSDTVKKGKFINQSSEANTTIYQGDKVEIIYSLGKEPTTEEKNALKKAESYSETMHMSKKGIYKQLTSEYGEGFTKKAAQYAIDNMEADWKANALEKAKSYRDTMSMSKNAIYKQLISEYGEQFTETEAQYAIDHLDD